MLNRSNMENLYEKLSFVDEEISFQEDSTASSSSLGTTLSEEDDLRLGAEANSFAFDKNGSNLKTRQPEYFVVKKHYKEPEYQMSRAYSTISSIKDLLDARDCDAEEVLFNLGFVSNNGQDSRESILSRFATPEQGSPLEPSQYSQQASGASSITKTREWLEKHGGNSEIGSYLKSMKSKSRQNSTSSIEFGGTYQPKRQKSRPNTLRKKWSSKSRQSSFDRLPNLKEEDPIVEERKSLSGPEILTRSASPLVKSSAFDHVKSIKSGSSNYGDSERGHGVNLISKNKGNNGGGNSFKAIVSSKTMQTVTNSNLPGNSLQYVLMKNLKSTELKEAQTDSFELEEIMSDGHLEESTNKVPNKLSFVDNHRRRRQGVVANPFNRTDDTTTPTSIASDASSGFCEPTDHHKKYKTILPIVSQSETGANTNTQRSLVNDVAKKFHGNFKTIESLENAFKSYCDEKAKIICASATAKAAMKLRNCDHTNKLVNETRKNLNIFSSFINRSKGKATSKFHCEKGNVLTSSLYRCYSTEALKIAKCPRHRQPKNSFSYNPNARGNANIQKLTRFHSLPQLNFSLPEQFDKSSSLMSSISEVSASALSTRHKQSLNSCEPKVKKTTLNTKEDIPEKNDETSKSKVVRRWENIDFKTEQCPECRKNFNLSFDHKDEGLTGVLKHDGNVLNNNFVNNEDVERIKVMNLLTLDSNEDKGKGGIEPSVSPSVVDKLSENADLSHLFPIKDISVTVNGHS